MSDMQLMAEGFQKIAERREKALNIINLVGAFFEMAHSIISELPSDNVVRFKSIEKISDEGSPSLDISGVVESKDSGDSYPFKYAIDIAASGAVKVDCENEYGSELTLLFDMDDYAVADAFAKIILHIENDEHAAFGSHLRHVQKVIKEGMGMSLANSPNPGL